jgi:hypothetical protein
MDRHRHIDHGLEYQAESDPDRKKGPEVSLAFRCDPDNAEKEDTVQKHHESASHNTVFFHNNGKDEIRIGVRQEIPLRASSR